MTEETISKFERQLEVNLVKMKKYGRFSKLQRILNEQGYLEGTKFLIEKSNTSGLADLFAEGKQELSLEYLAIQPEFVTLFTADQLTKCRRKLGL